MECVLTFIVIMFAWIILLIFYEKSDESTARDVRTILNATHAGMDKWLDLNMRVTRYYANTQRIKTSVKKLLKLSPAEYQSHQSDMRSWYNEINLKYKYAGYFLISRDGINLSSSRDNNLGIKSLLLLQDGLLDKVFAGEVVTSAPLKTDVPILVNGKYESKLYNIFTIAPIYDEKNTVIAALAFRINPEEEMGYFISRAISGGSIKVAAVDINFQPIIFSGDKDYSYVIPSKVKKYATQILQSERMISEQLILLDNTLYDQMIGAVLWDKRLEMGLFAYIEEKDTHGAYHYALVSVVALTLIVVVLIWIALWTIDRSGRKLQKAHDWLESLLNAIPSIIYVVAKNGDLRFGNNNLRLLEGGRNVINNALLFDPKTNKADNLCGKSFDVSDIWGPWCTKVIRTDNQVVIINFSYVSMLDESGEPVDLIVANDVTNNMEVEIEKGKLLLQLQQAQKMEAIGQLTGGVAHDFNNMLSAILGYNSLSLEYFSEGNEKLIQYLTEVDRAGRRAQVLVQQMLAYSRKSVKIYKRINAAMVVKESISLLKSTIPSNIEIVQKISVDHAEINIDPVQLQQIIMNLVINSRDAIKESGIVVCSVDNIDISDQCCSSCHVNFTGRFNVISVQDNGEGIDSEKLLKIFEPFYTSKEVGKGSGMGLSMVHGIVHSVDGHIVVNSRSGLGTEIVLYFPETTVKSQHVKQKTA